MGQVKSLRHAHHAPCGWIAALVIGLAPGAAVAAPPPSPETASEIERALSVPGGAQPGLRLRGGPSSGSPGVGRLRGPAGIVDDPAATTSTVSPPAIASPPVDMDYPALVRDRPKVAALIHFDTNSAHIRSDAYKLLNEYVNALKSPVLAGAVLVIAGHTDAVGSDQRNLELSQERAQAVKDYLIERGIVSNRLIAKGYGEAYPVASNATEAGRELNRRSEFIRVDGAVTDNP
ncbi:MAG TPA: OmpA family protein [Candidatus Competibacter sp.]|nr:OmpA family protein [Candidatus Competibacter sp.]